ncbi:MAG: PAS domain S-box protein, partial [Campylobacterales bacterium]
MDFFRGVFESIGLPILVYESDGFSILYANESARSFFGLSSKEIEKLSIETLFSAKILKKEGVFTQEVVLGDNETKLVEATISHIDKKAKKASIIFRDITKEMHEKESILNENERYRLAIEGANDGLWDWNIDTGEAYHSNSFATMLGYNPEELKTTYLAWAENLHPDDKDAAIKRAKEYIEGKTKVYDSEFRLKKKNGEYIWIRGRGKLVKDKNTGTTRFVGSNQDITNKVELQKQLEKQNQLLEKIFNNSVVMIYVKNSSGEYLKVNKYFRKFFGLKDSDIQKGIKTKKLVELDEYEAILNTEAKVLHSKKPGTQKSVKINNKDGVTHYFNITKVLLNPEAPLEEREMLGIAVDVTEFVVMGSKLDALNKLLQKDIKKEKDGKDSALKEIKEKDILLLQ